MKKWVNNSKKGMAVFGAAAFMLVAGWQFGLGGTDAPSSENEVALENAIAGSGNGCYQAMRRCQGQMTAYNCISDYTAWACSQYYCKDC